MSNLSIFKIGIGPSSSHTVGPFVAAGKFCEHLKSLNALASVARVQIILHGSLSLTGKGHLSDQAVILGLNGLNVSNISVNDKEAALLAAANGSINLAALHTISFNQATDLLFDNSFLPLHENGLIIKAFDANNNELASKTYYSIGGGFIKEESEFSNSQSQQNSDILTLPYSFSSATELLWNCNKYSKNIAQISLLYELNFHDESYINAYTKDIYLAMKDSFLNGAHSQQSVLPGPIHLRRRAPALAKKLAILDAKKSFSPKNDLDFIDYFSLYAMAIAEENAAGGRVVTAPTNGACAVTPAVLLYLKNHVKDIKGLEIRDFLLVAMAIGSLFKRNASISGAEAGCQAEIGSASSMAAAAFAYAMGASAAECASAAEIAMEHHLGLTCDPVAGLVQIPCIERNTFGAIKAVSAAKMAMDRDSAPSVGLDEVIRTMYETGKDMNLKYKETSLGGLATNFKGMC